MVQNMSRKTGSALKMSKQKCGRGEHISPKVVKDKSNFLFCGEVSAVNKNKTVLAYDNVVCVIRLSEA